MEPELGRALVEPVSLREQAVPGSRGNVLQKSVGRSGGVTRE